MEESCSTRGPFVHVNFPWDRVSIWNQILKEFYDPKNDPIFPIKGTNSLAIFFLLPSSVLVGFLCFFQRKKKKKNLVKKGCPTQPLTAESLIDNDLSCSEICIHGRHEVILPTVCFVWSRNTEAGLFLGDRELFRGSLGTFLGWTVSRALPPNLSSGSYLSAWTPILSLMASPSSLSQGSSLIKLLACLIPSWHLLLKWARLTKETNI